MSTVVNTALVKIGNSQGIRIPKTIIEQIGLSGDVRLEVESDHLIIRPARPTRAGWDEQFAAMAERGDDGLLDGDGPMTAWDETEWRW